MAPGQPDLVCDFWTELGRNTAARVLALDDPAGLTPEQFMAIREEEDYTVMERLRRRVEGIVDDKDTAEALKPYYRFLCKRPCSNDDYLPTFNRPNVTLVDVSATKGVERATPMGLVANGVEYEVDCIIYASGFEITTEISRRYSIEAIEGRDGLSLFDHWRDGYRTFHGMTSKGFPNQFFTGFTQVGISANIAANYELQGEHIAYVIAQALGAWRGNGRTQCSGAGRLVHDHPGERDRQHAVRPGVHAGLLQQRRGWCRTNRGRRHPITPR